MGDGVVGASEAKKMFFDIIGSFYEGRVFDPDEYKPCELSSTDIRGGSKDMPLLGKYVMRRDVSLEEAERLAKEGRIALLPGEIREKINNGTPPGETYSCSERFYIAPKAAFDGGIDRFKCKEDEYMGVEKLECYSRDGTGFVGVITPALNYFCVDAEKVATLNDLLKKITGAKHVK